MIPARVPSLTKNRRVCTCLPEHRRSSVRDVRLFAAYLNLRHLAVATSRPENPTMSHKLLSLALCIALGACNAAEDEMPLTGEPDASPIDDVPSYPGVRTVFGGDRPATLNVPPNYTKNEPAPLLVLLHGYSELTTYMPSYTGTTNLHETEGIFTIAPVGTPDETGQSFWSGTDACCDFYDSGLDDVAYLGELITDIMSEYAIDPKRVWVIGHSNGAFMANRLACERADLVAAVVSMAGANFKDPGRCQPSEPVSLLQYHGTEDATIAYLGGATTHGDGEKVPYPAAEASVAQWAALNGCDTTTTAEGTLDLDGTVPGEEAEVVAHTGCPDGIDTRLWRGVGSGHIVVFNTATAPSGFIEWLKAHPKP